MTRRSLANVAQSVHQRLLTRAQETHRPFNELLQHYGIERFLYRLGRSPHAEQLLLKGALLLRVWKIPMARPTMDIDVLGRDAVTMEALIAILRDCMTLEVEDDGMTFDPGSVVSDIITPEADYQGWRIRFNGSLGNARLRMQVDVGVGDAVYPAPIWIDYPVLLDQPAPHLRAYSVENAVAEKFQAMVDLDMANSRMKDFHDIWTLANNLEFDGAQLSEAIRRTFQRRQTPLPTTIPTAFTPAFYDDKTKQAQWRAFLNRGLAANENASLEDIAKVLSDFLMPPTQALRADRTFKMHWPQGGPWRKT